MSKRAISPGQSAWLREELEAWRAQSLLSDEQAGGILALYESADEAARRQQSRALFTLMGVASFLVGLAALLLVGYNWEAMPRALKLALLFGAIGGAHAAGLYLRFGREARRASEVVLFLGCLFYGVGIWQVAQIFHLRAHYPDGVWWWALGVLPFALCLDTLLLHGLYAGLLALWVGVEVLGGGHALGWRDGAGYFLAHGTATLPLLAVPGLLWAYRAPSPAAVGLYAPVLAWWLVLQAIAWGPGPVPVYFLAAVGALFLLLAKCHSPGSPFAVPYRLYGLLLTGIALAVMSFYDFNRDALGRPSALALAETLTIAALAAAVLALTVAVQRARSAHRLSFTAQASDLLRRHWLPASVLLLAALLPLSGFLLGGGPSGRTEMVATAVAATVLVNLAMLAGALWLIGVGLREDLGRLFAAGVVYFLLWAILRYLDLFGDFGGMPGAALMFFLCGLVLFGVGLYWRRRKEARHV